MMHDDGATVRGPQNQDSGGALPRFCPLTLGYMGLFVENSDPVSPCRVEIAENLGGAGLAAHPADDLFGLRRHALFRRPKRRRRFVESDSGGFSGPTHANVSWMNGS